jgi:hypothetical protein
VKARLKANLPPGTVIDAPSLYLTAKRPEHRAYRGRKADIQQFVREAELARMLDAQSALPQRWTVQHVAARLIEAFLVIARLPAVPGPAKVKSLWPALNRSNSMAPLRHFASEEAWREALEDVAAQEALRDVAKWAFGKFKAPPRPAEITRADKVMSWPARFLTKHTAWVHHDGRLTTVKPKSDSVMRARSGGKRHERVDLWREVTIDAEGAARILRAWIIAKARGRANGNDDLKRLCKKRGWAYSTFRRKRAAALAIIADGLNHAGEKVF